MVILVYKEGTGDVRIESENLKEWEGYGYSTESAKEYTREERAEIIAKAVELGIGEEAKLKKLSTKVIDAKIDKIEA